MLLGDGLTYLGHVKTNECHFGFLTHDKDVTVRLYAQIYPAVMFHWCLFAVWMCVKLPCVCQWAKECLCVSMHDVVHREALRVYVCVSPVQSANVNHRVRILTLCQQQICVPL